MSESAVTERFQAQIDKLPSASKLDAALKALEKSEADHLETLHATIQAEIAAAFERMNQKEQQDMGELKSALEKAEHELEEKQNEQVDELMRGIEGSHNLLTGQIQEAVALAHKEVVEAEEHETEIFSKEVFRLDETISSMNAALLDRCETLRQGMDDLNANLEHTTSVMKKADMDLASKCESEFRALKQQLRDEHERGLEWMKGHTGEMMSAIDSEIKPRLATIDRTSWILDNMYTRTVTWQIRGFKYKLAKLLQQSERVLQSPPFSVCAQPEMVLDMLAAPEQESSVPLPIPPLPTAGSASIRLWAPPGYHLGFRLTLGAGSSAVTRRFEHTFKAGEIIDSQGRTSFQMKNLCQLDHIWNRKANAVNVTLEVLEMRYGDNASLSPEDEADSYSALVEGLDPENEEDKDALLEAAVADSEKPHPDKIVTSRSLTSDFLMQERIQSQLQVMRNKTVRRVEWQLEGCSRLLEVLKAGEAVASPLFSAAGIDTMQIHFYPRGCEASDKTSNHGQPCAIYVSGPYRTTLRGVLSVGSNSRQFEQRYQRRGDVGGRGKFCALESQVDLHDKVTLALEIVEVESDLPDMSSSLVLRDTQNAGPVSPGGGNGTHVGGGAKGSLKMKSDDPKKTEEVVRCISLPALNTRQQFLPKVPQPGLPKVSQQTRSGQRSR